MGSFSAEATELSGCASIIGFSPQPAQRTAQDREILRQTDAVFADADPDIVGLMLYSYRRSREDDLLRLRPPFDRQSILRLTEELQTIEIAIGLVEEWLGDRSTRGFTGDLDGESAAARARIAELGIEQARLTASRDATYGMLVPVAAALARQERRTERVRRVSAFVRRYAHDPVLVTFAERVAGAKGSTQGESAGGAPTSAA